MIAIAASCNPSKVGDECRYKACFDSYYIIYYFFIKNV